MRRAFGFAIALLLFPGCATIRQNIAETAKWQAKADQATAAAGVGQVTVVLRRAAGYGGMYYRSSRTLELNPDFADPRDVERLFAHELSHHLLGHAGALLENEIAANANAVLLLVSWGWTEQDAVLWSERSRLANQRLHNRLAGHDWCAEYQDLARRYSQYPPPSDAATLCGQAAFAPSSITR